MIASSIQQFDTLQQYLRCLFDSFDSIDLESMWKEVMNTIDESSFVKMIQTLIAYGKKIMQMSQQSTYKYRNEHFLQRKIVQEELKYIYSLITNEESRESYQQIIQDLILKLRTQRKSIIHKISLPQSRYIYSQVKNQIKKIEQRQTLHEERVSHVTNRISSKGKSKISKVNSIKQVLKIKNYFQNQQNKIREYFDKVTKMIQINKVAFNNNLIEKFKYSRLVDENNSENIADLVKISTENHSKNIDNMINLVQILNQNLTKRLKNEGFAEAKLNLFLEQAQRMEEVYSFSLSKLLQNLQSAKHNIQENPKLSNSYLQNSQEITRKLYGLYPTNDSFKEIMVKIKTVDESKKNYGIQVNIEKKNNDKKISTESFRTQVKINQCLQRFQKNAKYRKTFEMKEIQKLFENIRENLPSKYTPSQPELIFQQQYKRLSQISQKQQKQLTQSFNKKTKKLEKKIQQLELQITQLRKNQGSISDQWQNEKKKLLKKIQSEQNDYKKILKQKQILQKNLNEYLKDIQNLKQSIRAKNEEQLSFRKRLQTQKQNTKQKYESNYKKLNDLSSEYYNEKQKMSEQRIIYKQKIQLLQRKLSQSNELSTGLKIQLQQLIVDNNKLKANVQEMSRIYEQKIKQVEQMIQNIRQLQKVKNNQDVLLQKMSINQRRYQQKIQEFEKNNQLLINQIQLFDQEKIQLRQQINHWKQEGKLTDGDLKTLKQEVQKVNNAYLQTQEILQNTKQQLNIVAQQRERLFRQKIKLNRLIEDLQSQLHTTRAKNQSLELSQRDLKDQYYQKSQQNSRLLKENQQIKRQISRIKRQLYQEKEQRLKIDKQFRQLRQENQQKKESQSIQNGKRRLQLQNMRIQLRRKTEQIEKQKETYEEKINIMTQKMKQIEQFTGQKQQLSKLLQNHQTK